MRFFKTEAEARAFLAAEGGFIVAGIAGIDANDGFGVETDAGALEDALAGVFEREKARAALAHPALSAEEPPVLTPHLMAELLG